jgi:uncharacterized protein
MFNEDANGLVFWRDSAPRNPEMCETTAVKRWSFMKTKIVNQLKQIEKDHKVRILYAVESGSRAWGFASKDSDYDVRFVYIHKEDWYLALDEKRDVIEYMDKENDLDISGWDIRKTLVLFKKSNPPLYEWLESPVVYLDRLSFKKNLGKIVTKYFSPKAAFHHYLSMLVNNHKDYVNHQQIKMKKYFYVLRPLFACDWIEKNDTMPPMEFEKLLMAQPIDKDLFDEISALLKNKQAGLEQGLAPRKKVLDDYIEERISYFERLGNEIKPVTSPRIEVLNQLFRKTLKNAWSK